MDDQDCIVCMEKALEPEDFIQCPHCNVKIHKKCFQKWVNYYNSPKCPGCRKEDLPT